MRPRDLERGERLERQLGMLAETQDLFGIQTPHRRAALIGQILDSARRVKYYQVIAEREISSKRIDPDSTLFDPIRASLFFKRRADTEEAFWLSFLSVHFGKSRRGGWRLLREVYGKVNGEGLWDWESVKRDPDSFRDWLDSEQEYLKRPSPPGGFGNHRKYESLGARSDQGTGAVITSYIEWVSPPRSQHAAYHTNIGATNADPALAFEKLYESMKPIARFGRTARFDLLTRLANLGLINAIPARPFLSGATGPLRGARLLFDGTPISQSRPSDLERRVLELDVHIDIGMQVFEDALCNWQKNPDRFVAFRG